MTFVVVPNEMVYLPEINQRAKFAGSFALAEQWNAVFRVC